MKICDIKINGITNPVGFHLDQVKVSWKVRESESCRAENIRIEVSKKADFSDCIWKKDGAELKSIGQEIGVRVEPCTRYYCRVTVTGDKGDQASGIAFFERGKGRKPWNGKFISTAKEDKFLPVFEKKFEIKSSSVTEKNENGFVPGIAQARLYITGLGLYEAYINGKKAGDDILAPFCNDNIRPMMWRTAYALVRIIPFPSTAAMAGTRADWVTMVHPSAMVQDLLQLRSFISGMKTEEKM